MANTAKSIGIDIGSVSVKLARLENGRLIDTVYRRFQGSPFETLAEILREHFGDRATGPICFGATGIGGKTTTAILGGRFYGEIASLARGNFELLPSVRTVIEMGGEDSKLLLLDPVGRVVSDFAMNAICAAGTGSFLDQQASRMGLDIETEFGALALKSEHPPRIAGRCSVFAKSDMIHLQQIATPDYDIVAGLCFAVARNFKSTIARGKTFVPPVAFEGGVAANPGMVRAFAEILELKPEDLIVPPHHDVIGAVGAAHLAFDDQVVVDNLNPDTIRQYLEYRQTPDSGRSALSFDNPSSKHYAVTLAAPPRLSSVRDVYLGIDVGSLSTNLVLIDRDHQVIARRYLMTAGRPIEAVRQGLQEIGDEVGRNVRVLAVGTTGSGRYLIGDLTGADVVRNEITAQATAAVTIDPTVDTIFEIGGQDSKYISIDDRAVVDFEMNKACAAGTGSFLQEQAEKLDIRIDTEFGERALRASCPVGCGERCTVFMESDLVAHQRTGTGKDDLVAGLAYSIVSNYLTKVVGDRRIGDNIFFQGGVAWNRAVVAAFEKLTGKTITVPPHHDVTGAIGAALLAREATDQSEFTTRFRGFDLYRRKYELETFACEDCSNQCEIHQVDLEGEKPLYYGSRCEKYDVSGPPKDLPPDYVKLRQKLHYRRYLSFDVPKRSRGRVGVPRVLHFLEYFPFWQAFFDSLGFQVVHSDVSNAKITSDALEMFVAETCYPIKMVFGHVANLLSKDVDYVFIPSLIKAANESEAKVEDGYICPYVQAVGASLESRFDFSEAGAKLVATPIMLSRDPEELLRNLKGLASELGLSRRELRRAVQSGTRAFGMYRKAIRDEGQRILANLKADDKIMVVVSRPYNGYDPRLSLEIPKKLRRLGYHALPVDFLAHEDGDKDHPYMYWRYGRRILSVAAKIRRHPNLFAVYITSFGCGPDSFIMHFFRREMFGKPYLQLELDEHSADAGLITRCEAFIDSLRFYRYESPKADIELRAESLGPRDKTIFIPNMCDHAYAMRAAMERHGLNAVVMDEPDDLTLELGKKFTSGRECFPCLITTGDIIKYLRSDGFDRSRSVFFMPGANGPCRFGLYNQYHRLVLDDLGYQDVPILSPDSRNGYAEFGLDQTDLRTAAWKGMVLIDQLIRMTHRVRPYEVVPSTTDKLYYRYLHLVDQTIVQGESLEQLAEQAGKDFAAVETSGEHRSVVGVVGEIYLRNNRFSNNHLVVKLEKLGLEVWLATFTEWPMYTSGEFRRDSRLARNYKGMIRGHLQLATQRWHEGRILKAVTKHFPLPHELPVAKVLKLSARYLPRACKGEALLSIGKGIEMKDCGAAGIVNAMPFNCMPGTIVSGLSGRVSKDLGELPWLNISYEGLRDSGEETRLEAFSEQVKSFDNNHSRELQPESHTKVPQTE
jgi:predicted CoA-substrate-specific enzyme activase